MRRAILLILLFIILLVAPTAVRYFQFYDLSGAAERVVPVYDVTDVPTVPTPEASQFADDPVVGDGLVLIDQAHDNQFTLEEMTFLDGRLAARGFDLLSYDGGDLATALRPANAFIVIAPLVSYSESEVLAVSNFVSRGGRLLMIGDPSRFGINIEEDPVFGPVLNIETNKLPLNSLANAFDLVFNGDYLYNTLENEGNFRNIILEPKGDVVNDNISKLAFYGSHSLEVGPQGEAVLTGDDNTWSSATDRPGGRILAASSHEGNVLALGDIHFFLPPYHTVFDNSRFIAQIADFLTDSSERGLVLGDFPYFYQTAVNLVYVGQPDLGAGNFDEIIALQNAFQATGKTIALANEADASNDTLYVGLYNQAEEIADLLAAADITLMIDPPILTEEEMVEEEAEEEGNEEEAEEETEETAEEDDAGKAEAEDPDAKEEMVEEIRLIESALGNVEMAGTALVLLDEDDGQRNVIVLAASTQGLESILYRLIDLIPRNAALALSDCLLQDNLALCPTHISEEPVEAELGASPISPPPVEPPVIEPPPAIGEPAEIEGVNQGAIVLGEPQTAVLAASEKHTWTFSSEPAFIDVVLENGDDLDGILELFAPDGTLIINSDTGTTGVVEQLIGVELTESGDYTIRVSDFFADGGEYTLTVNAGSETSDQAGVEINNVFIFGDDDGNPTGDGFTSVTELATLLGERYTVTTWLSSEDGVLTEGILDGIDLFIWDSGDFREETLFNEDVEIIFQFIDQGGSLLIIGASPTLLADVTLAPLSDLEIIGDDTFLTNGFAPSQVIELNQTYETAVPELQEPGPDEVQFLQRGPASEEAGTLAALANTDSFSGQRTAFLLFPFTALPDDIQPLLLENIMAWFTGGFG